MAYYECTYKDDIIGIGDRFTVALTGSHNLTITATVCYISKSAICLLSSNSLGEVAWSTASNYAWNYNVNIKGKEYTGTCRIPTLKQIYSKCAGYKRDFHYWTSTPYDGSNSYYVSGYGFVSTYNITWGYHTLPFIEITL